MNSEHFHTIVIGGGCLGSACAISLARRLDPNENRVCIVDQSLIASGLSARHSGIVRAANSSAAAARLAKESIKMWEELLCHWGVSIQYTKPGALWINPNTNSTAQRWRKLARTLDIIGIDFFPVTQGDAQAIAGNSVALGEDELFYFEPNVLLFDPADVRAGLYRALADAHVSIKEHTLVTGFIQDPTGRVSGIRTAEGELNCDHLINAAGAWAPSLFEPLGVKVPIRLEAVHVANWVANSAYLSDDQPVIADFRHLLYFRRWVDGSMHVHQPRRRSATPSISVSQQETESPVPEAIRDPSNYGSSPPQLSKLEAKLAKRFPSFSQPVYSGGYTSFFDITPDLGFVLGSDTAVPNLFHCLGGGQAFKYAPVFGRLIADMILKVKTEASIDELSEFSISRFEQQNLEASESVADACDHAL